MEWYQYLAAFFSGAFLANAVPHFVQGVSGNKFPTPFAKPPGEGLSSSTTNVVWALFNALLGWLLLGPGEVERGHTGAMIAFFAGIAVLSIPLSIRFRTKHKE